MAKKNALEQFREEYEVYKKSYEMVGMAVVTLNETLGLLQNSSARLEALVGDIMFENLELRQAQWRGES